jgi:hypothetical protein
VAVVPFREVTSGNHDLDPATKTPRESGDKSLLGPLGSRLKDSPHAKRVHQKTAKTSPRRESRTVSHQADWSASKDEHRFLLTRERPAVTKVVAWAASNGDRSENADYLYGKRRLRQIDGRIRFLTKRIDAAEVVDRESPRAGQAATRAFFGATVRYANAAEGSEW